MSPYKEIFPRQGRALVPISPLMPLDDCDQVRALKATYANATKLAFPDEKIALSVVRNNLHNRLDHARRNSEASREAMIAGKNPEMNNVLAHFASSSPEERVYAFMHTHTIPALEAHAELLDDNTAQAGNFPEGEIAVSAFATDYDGEVVDADVRSRTKVMRIVRFDDEEFAVVRSKIDGLKARFGDDEIEVKIRRSGAVALSTVENESTRLAFKILNHLPGLPMADTQHVRESRAKVEDYIANQDNAYKGYVQSYYLTRR